MLPIIPFHWNEEGSHRKCANLAKHSKVDVIPAQQICNKPFLSCNNQRAFQMTLTLLLGTVGQYVMCQTATFILSSPLNWK